MLTQTDVNVLQMLATGARKEELAEKLNLSIEEVNSIYANLLLKTESKDDLELGLWWGYNEKNYLTMLQQ